MSCNDDSEIGNFDEEIINNNKMDIYNHESLKDNTNALSKINIT